MVIAMSVPQNNKRPPSEWKSSMPSINSGAITMQSKKYGKPERVISVAISAEGVQRRENAPHAKITMVNHQQRLKYPQNINGVTNTYGASLYYEHEVGVNEVSYTGVKTAIPAYIESGDFDLDIEGDGQYLMKINRFIPDFKILTGNAKVTLLLRDYPSQTQNSQMLGPYTVTSSTTKIDTRARNRLMSIKVENDSTDENWRYGLFRVDIQPDGRR